MMGCKLIFFFVCLFEIVICLKAPVEDLLQDASLTRSIAPKYDVADDDFKLLDSISPQLFAEKYAKAAPLYNQALSHWNKGEKEAAVKTFFQAAETNPYISHIWNNLGSIAQTFGYLDAAMEFTERALALETNRIERATTYSNLGNLMVAKKRQVGSNGDKYGLLALRYLKLAAEMNPKDVDIAFRMAYCYFDQNLPMEALEILNRFIGKKKGKNEHVPEAFYSLASAIYTSLQQYSKSEKILKKGLKVFPNSLNMRKELGDIYRVHLGDLNSALQHLTTALEQSPSDVSLMYSLGACYSMAGHLETAIGYHQRVLEKDPNFGNSFMEMVLLKHTICDWRNRTAELKRLKHMVLSQIDNETSATLAPWHAIGYPFSASELLQISRIEALKDQNKVFSSLHLPSLSSWRTNPKFGDGYLRVGLVSGDIGDSNVGRDLVGWFIHHNPQREKIHLLVYSNRDVEESEWTRAVENKVFVFRRISSLPAVEVANQIQQDQVLLLVNLNGYTKYSRNEVFALQPCPIQIAHKGFAGSLGAKDWISHLIADRTIAPSEHSAFFDEKLMFLPHSFFLTSYPDAFGHVISTHARSNSALFPDDDTFVFANFNHLVKLDPDTFSIWLNILRQVPNSALWLMRLPKEAETYLKNTANDLRGRIIFSDLFPVADHLVIKQRVNLFLDTPIFNAHGTATDVLWAGIPVLTTAFEPTQGRVAASHLRNLGLDALLVAWNMEDYEDRAVYLGSHPRKLQRLVRARLEADRLRYPLFDTRFWVSEMGRMLRGIWDEYCSRDGGSVKSVIISGNWKMEEMDYFDRDHISKFLL